MAMRGDSNTRFSFKHTKNIRDRIDAAQATIAQTLAQFERNVEAYQSLAAKKVTRQAMTSYVRRVFIPEQKDLDNEVSGKLEAKVQTVIDLLDNQRGMELVPAIRGTAWQAYNAVSEYLTHDYGHTDDSRLNAQWFGASAKDNSRALNMALAM
jgi:hypothetical protein